MSGRMKIAFLLATLIVTGLTSYAQARIWVDAEGRSVDAEFVKFEGNTVHLRRNDNGTMIEVLFTKFSEADKRRLTVLREQAEGPSAAAETNEMPKDYASSVGSSTPGDSKEVSEADARRELARSRKWSDDEGNQIQAKFVRIHEGNVILLQGNKGHNVDFYKLSDVDQSFLRAQLEAIGQGDDVPPVVVKSYTPAVSPNGAIAGNPSGMSNFPGQFGPQPGMNGNNGIGGIATNPATPIDPNESDIDRRIREYSQNFPNSKLANNSASQPVASNAPANPGMSSSPSSTPSYDPWANSSSGPSSSVTDAPTESRPPSVAPIREPRNPLVDNNSAPAQQMGKMPQMDRPGWECSRCGTQFDTVQKPKYCHFCIGLRIGGAIVLSLIGLAVKGAMSS